jgi:hypothetical protein
MADPYRIPADDANPQRKPLVPVPTLRHVVPINANAALNVVFRLRRESGDEYGTHRMGWPTIISASRSVHHNVIGGARTDVFERGKTYPIVLSADIG